MPYIDEKSRQGKHIYGPCHEFQESIDIVIANIRAYEQDDKEGLCNYAISRIIAGSMKPANGWKYKYLNRAYGTFLSAAAEFYRRLVAPYEDECIKRNGDIPEYQD